jgi:hypothetical protein
MVTKFRLEYRWSSSWTLSRSTIDNAGPGGEGAHAVKPHLGADHPVKRQSFIINYLNLQPQERASTHRYRQRGLRPIYLLAAIKQANSTDGPKTGAEDLKTLVEGVITTYKQAVHGQGPRSHHGQHPGFGGQAARGVCLP